MTKQLLFYENAKPVTRSRHKDLSIERSSDYQFARETNSVPIVVGEFQKVALEYPIVFIGVGENLQAVALLGLRDSENLYTAQGGAWDANYVPAFVRRYPFVFHNRSESDEFVLCIDEGFTGLNSEGRGNVLFDEEGETSDFLKEALEFTKTYQIQALRTQAFCERLRALDVLKPAQITFKLAGGSSVATRGILAIDKTQFETLSDETRLELMKSGDLELIYAHFLSLANADRLGERLRRLEKSPETD